jgi:hypothetical protein
MPLSLSDLFGKAEGHGREAHRAPGRAAELEAELAAEREREQQAQRAREQTQREAEAKARRVEKNFERRVVELEKSLPATRHAAAQAVGDEGTPPPDLRSMARQWLRGTLASGMELMPPEQPIAYRDGAVAT